MIKKMRINKLNLFPFLLMIILCIFTLVLSGCSGEDASISDLVEDADDFINNDTKDNTGGETDGGNSEDTIYAGLSKVLGSINLSSLVGQDQSAVTLSSSGSGLGKRANGRARGAQSLEDSNSVAEIDPNKEIVKLYVIGSDGELEDTGILCTCEVDPNDEDKIIYDCPDVKDGVNYIVKYIKLLDDNKALELKANVYVGENETEVNTEVTAKTTAVVESLKIAILDATMGTGITQEVVNKIVTAVEKVIVDLIDTGFIQLPSMIVDTEGDTLEEILGEDIENDNLVSKSGTLISDESVGNQLDAVKTEIKSEQFDLDNMTTDDKKANLVNRVFKEMLDDGDDDGVPGFMLEFLTDKFIENVTKSVGAVTDAVQRGIHFRIPLPEDAECTKDGAISAFKDALTKMYDLIEAKAAGTISGEDLKEFANIPPVVLGLFPKKDSAKWLNLDMDTELNIPQSLALTIFIVEGYISEAYESMEEEIVATEGEGGVVNHEKEDPFEFDAMCPGSLMDMLGFSEVAENYSGIDIFDLWLHPSKCWLESAQREVDMLNAGGCWGDVTGMLVQWDEDSTAPDYSTATVSLTYPKKGGGTGTVQLISEAEIHGKEDGKVDMWNNCWIIDPWMEANENNDGSDEWNEPDSTRIVSDFTSGKYTITVTWEGETISKDFTRKVITGMTKIYPELVSPAQMPQWPGHDATEEEMEKHDEEWSEYEMTNFSATEDTDGDGEEDAAKITIEWKAPVLGDDVLPDGVKMGYELDLGQGGCDENGCTWEHIYATWEHDKVLFGTSFTIPELIQKQETGDPPYQLHMHIIFIDQETGERLGEGGHTHGEFTVCDPLDLSQTFTITGYVDISNCNDEALELADVEDLKVALFYETYDENSFTNAWSRDVIAIGTMASSGGEITYTIEPSLGDFLGDDKEPGGWHNIIIFQDLNENDEIDERMSEAEPWPEPQYWPECCDNNMWFDTWGNMLRVHSEYCDENGTCEHEEIMITGDEEVNGPDFMVETWDDCYPSDDEWKDDNPDEYNDDEYDDPDEYNTDPTASIITPSDNSSYTDSDAIIFSGEGSDIEDGTLSGSSFVWESSLDGEIGTGDDFTTDDLTAGEHEITLTVTDSEGETASDSIIITITASDDDSTTVNTDPTATIETPSDDSSYTDSEAIIFSGEGSDPEDGTLSGSLLVWTSSLDGEIGTGDSFTTDDLTAGEHEITLTVTDSEGETASDSIIITITASDDDSTTVNTDPTATIVTPTDSSSYTISDTISFSGTGSDPEDGTLSGSSFVWTSSLDDQIGTGGDFTIDDVSNDLSVGEHTITLTVTDSESATATDSIIITITN